MGHKLPHVDMEHPYNPYPNGWEGDWMPYRVHVLEIDPEDYQRIQYPEHRERFIEGWDGEMMNLAVSKPNIAVRAISAAIGRKPKYRAYLETGMTPEDIKYRQEIMKD